MAVIHHQGCTLDQNHDETEQCVRVSNTPGVNSKVLGHPASEHARGCTLGEHTLDVPCGSFSYTPPAQRPPIVPGRPPARGGIITSRLDVEIPETPEQTAARHELDKPLIGAFDALRQAEDGKQRAKIQYGGLSVEVASEDPGLFGRVLSAIGEAITFALGDD